MLNLKTAANPATYVRKINFKRFAFFLMRKHNYNMQNNNNNQDKLPPYNVIVKIEL